MIDANERPMKTKRYGMPPLNINKYCEYPNFTVLQSSGYRIRDIWEDTYFDGIVAAKLLHGVLCEIYVGSDDGRAYFAPQVYVDDCRIGAAATLAKAARMVELRALIQRRRRVALPHQ